MFKRSKCSELYMFGCAKAMDFANKTKWVKTTKVMNFGEIRRWMSLRKLNGSIGCLDANREGCTI
ncbi:hypothetical protein Hdeb2414_s0666g00932601 [Helianthus debilis subsp. tardiflorus]